MDNPPISIGNINSPKGPKGPKGDRIQQIFLPPLNGERGTKDISQLNLSKDTRRTYSQKKRPLSKQDQIQTSLHCQPFDSCERNRACWRPLGELNSTGQNAYSSRSSVRSKIKLPPIIISDPSREPPALRKVAKNKINHFSVDNHPVSQLDQIQTNFPPSESVNEIIHQASDNWNPTILVLGPGGIKGFMELGALTKLSEKNILDNIETYFGVSVGSIICLLKIVGYTYPEIAEIGTNLNLFNGWEDINFKEILENNGLIAHEKLRGFLSNLVVAKIGRLPTFQQLYIITNNKLKVVAYNLTRTETCYFDHISHPDTPVIEAILASCTIPILFYKFKYNNEYYCDGAIGNPYPINIVDDGETDILGIYVTSSSDINNQLDLSWYLDKVVSATMSEYRKHLIEQSSRKCKHLKLLSDMQDITGLSLNDDEKVDMFMYGYDAAHTFLNDNFHFIGRFGVPLGPSMHAPEGDKIPVENHQLEDFPSIVIQPNSNIQIPYVPLFEIGNYFRNGYPESTQSRNNLSLTTNYPYLQINSSKLQPLSSQVLPTLSASCTRSESSEDNRHNSAYLKPTNLIERVKSLDQKDKELVKDFVDNIRHKSRRSGNRRTPASKQPSKTRSKQKIKGEIVLILINSQSIISKFVEFRSRIEGNIFEYIQKCFL